MTPLTDRTWPGAGGGFLGLWTLERPEYAERRRSGGRNPADENDPFLPFVPQAVDRESDFLRTSRCSLDAQPRNGLELFNLRANALEPQ